MLQWFASKASTGPAIEVGVYNGKSLRAIRKIRQCHGYDSLGLPEPCEHDNYHKAGDFAADKRIDGVIYGEFPQTWGALPLGFAHIDVDLYEPTKAALAAILPNLMAGAIVVVDDYGAPTCLGARKAVDEFGLPGIELPTEQWVYCSPWWGSLGRSAGRSGSKDRSESQTPLTTCGAW